MNTARNFKSEPKHSIKIEDLEISKQYADEIESTLRNWLEDNLGYSKERIEAIDCRVRSGFFPHSHNKGGLEGVAYRDQYSCCESTGFENCDATLVKYYEYDKKNFLEDKNLTELDYDNDELIQEFDECRQSDNQATVQFMVRCMITSETTIQLDCYVDAKDAPYHRTVDDKLEVEIEFKSIAGLAQKLKRLEKNDFIKTLKQNIREAF